VARAARDSTSWPAMIKRPRSPSTSLRRVSATTTPSRPVDFAFAGVGAEVFMPDDFGDSGGILPRRFDNQPMDRPVDTSSLEERPLEERTAHVTAREAIALL